MKIDLQAGRMISVVLTEIPEEVTPGLREKNKGMKRPFATIIRRMVDSVNGNRPLSGFAAADQFRPEEKGDEEVARNLNAAFLIGLLPPTPLVPTRHLEWLAFYSDYFPLPPPASTIVDRTV